MCMPVAHGHQHTAFRQQNMRYACKTAGYDGQKPKSMVHALKTGLVAVNKGTIRAHLEHFLRTFRVFFVLSQTSICR